MGSCGKSGTLVSSSGEGATTVSKLGLRQPPRLKRYTKDVSMPNVVLHKHGQRHQDEVPAGTNLVVRAGIRQFPYPALQYGCGMGKCAKCACRVLQGAEHLPAPNWKEKKQLGERLDAGYRLVCQLWVEHDIELAQDDAEPTATL
jgi:ferredoxin